MIAYPDNMDKESNNTSHPDDEDFLNNTKKVWYIGPQTLLPCFYACADGEQGWPILLASAVYAASSQSHAVGCTAEDAEEAESEADVNSRP